MVILRWVRTGAAMGLDFLAHQKDKGKNWPSLIFRSTIFFRPTYVFYIKNTTVSVCIFDNIFRMTLAGV